jgi:hypothetical protein
MANKSIYQDYNNDALKHFSLEDEPFYGLYSSGIDDVLITDDSDDFNKISNILENETKNVDQNFKKSKYKRAFILPGSGLTQERIKALCKEHSITVTNDYEKADVIITNHSITQTFENSENINLKRLMYSLNNYYAYGDTNGSFPPIDKYNNPVIYTTKWEFVNQYSCTDEVDLYDAYAIPGLALNIAYLIDTGVLDVVHEDTIVICSSSNTILTEDLVEELTDWLSSGEENRNLAGKILPTIDYTKNHHLLWRLSQKINNQLWHFRRDKDVQYWLEQSQIDDYYHMNAQDMIEYLEKLDLLNAENFKYLEPEVRKTISICNRELYVVKVAVKKKYRKFYEKNSQTS